MSLNLQTLRNELREHLGIDEQDMVDAVVDRLLNLSYWEIMDKFHLRETQSSTTLTTVAGTREYPVPADLDSLRISAIVDPDSEKHKQLVRMTIKEYEESYDESVEEQGFPVKYFRDGENLTLYPTPDNTYTIILYYRTRLADLDDDSDIPQTPQSWHEIILAGGIWRGYKRLGDYERAPKAKKDYYDMLATAVPTESKEEFDSSTAGLSVLGRDY